MQFAKAQACGNDFLLIPLADAAGRDLGALSRALCDRHLGVGADGVEFYDWHDGHPRLDLYNADGSPAAISGNGTRCAAAWLARAHGFRQGAILTGSGVRRTTVLGCEAGEWRVETDMGSPDWRAEAIPLRHAVPLAGLGRWQLDLPARGALACHALSLGNPQALIEVEDFSNDWPQLAAELQASRHFPAGVNVEFWRRLDAHAIEIRIVERGAGVTLSSGTGSCAAALAAIGAGAAGSPVRVVSPGGEQTVIWQDGKLQLQGAARIIAAGEILLDAIPDPIQAPLERR